MGTSSITAECRRLVTKRLSSSGGERVPVTVVRDAVAGRSTDMAAMPSNGHTVVVHNSAAVDLQRGAQGRTGPSPVLLGHVIFNPAGDVEQHARDIRTEDVRVWVSTDDLSDQKLIASANGASVNFEGEGAPWRTIP